ncbi:bifunctional 23S rRNA (guanine(2069)-N(7))-methyltransferase RlmK/23S rRNA (guanine(2445)-N(2))-methyltransferase RlmL [Bremerella cremea]|uniref:site-specific DNA-methyltransferase (cytosine-N(4)-specific) n=1 Tax=Blastopirellula marina TaxID=124 RepID=A0A2S8FSS2_9BACT|nr:MULTISPECIES: bifunctional 23S rRNA (guanine(2069)-N(7))-methyltransferase RlmK/23S rRNA (guanine(2445)-N(2))-methyltransferase RlmL [Pirellulaceae]PQO34884.1 bifunctional 23S rRNA (guanine(2069)-N(7))-methyltransferase RlmK/23S rRNA (guanine(2445)-N(2))-methyltransferase RlmL [Blastopirellula marina]RCS47384.1 bifunctional 23S rRNA (guanine(2069)-N(7))-methyltransferase RlmK/23S rRNA (guanine(2445)-N(2))-methyltransferase RlmL [Bremerella cremea]
MNESSPLNFLATTAFGIEAVTARELQQLGYQTEILGSGRVRFQGTLTDAMRANLWLRTADRVLIEVAQIPAGDFDALFEGVKEIAWENYIDVEGAFPVKGRSYQSQLTSVPAIQRSTKRAVVERLQAAHNAELPETGATYTIEVAIAKDVATLTIDTSGAGLSRRGYLDEQRFAPMKSTLAAALVQLSHWNRERPLLDPFCGSGIILIEAALIGKNIAPGLLRDFALIDWPTVDQDAWLDMLEDARALQVETLPETIVGYDDDPSALRLARQQAMSAGVDQHIHFQKQSFNELTSKRKYGCVITSPPYDDHSRARRMEWDKYRSFPDVLRRLPTWSFFILTAFPEMERAMGQEANRRRKMYNGRVECHYFQYHGPPPPKKDERPAKEDSLSDEATIEETPKPKRTITPAFGGLDEKAREQAQLLKNRLVKRARHFRRWPKRGIHCYRLYERDIPEIPLVIDIYHDYLHITDYDRPHDRTPAQYADWLDNLAEAARESLEIPEGHVFVKHRTRQAGNTQHEKVSDDSKIVVVEEGGLKFEVNLSDYVDTGLFLDHRNLRAKFREEAAGKRVLNLFCYTGAFSVYAAAGGAISTTSVDLNGNYLDWAGRNFQLNGLSIAKHYFIRADVMQYLPDQPPGAKFDLAIVDVPTFSNSKKTDDVFDVQQDHVELIQRTLGLMSPDGVLYFSNNFRRFKLDEEALGGLSIREISKHTVPEDFRNQRIHRCWRISKV